jgi:hypothetical protein
MSNVHQQHSFSTDLNSALSWRALAVRAAVGVAIARRLDDRRDRFDPISVGSGTGARSSGGAEKQAADQALGRTTPIATRSCGLVHQNRMRCAATLARGAKIADSTPHTILLNELNRFAVGLMTRLGQ